MKTRVLLSLFLVTVVQAFSSAPAGAQESSLFQELGFFYTGIRSDHPELPSPQGFGAFTRWQIAQGWLLRLSYHRTFEHTEKPGVVCDQYPQRIECRTEDTVTDVTFSGLRGSLSRAIRVGRWVELGLGGGLSFNHVKPEAFDLTGWEADLLIPNTGQLGYLASLSATAAPFGRLPVLLVGGFTGHWVNFNGCSGEDPPQYDPFCGWATLKEVELGLSYAF
jgi:hypothetical protein